MGTRRASPEALRDSLPSCSLMCMSFSVVKLEGEEVRNSQPDTCLQMAITRHAVSLGCFLARSHAEGALDGSIPRRL